MICSDCYVYHQFLVMAMSWGQIIKSTIAKISIHHVLVQSATSGLSLFIVALEVFIHPTSILSHFAVRLVTIMTDFSRQWNSQHAPAAWLCPNMLCSLPSLRLPPAHGLSCNPWNSSAQEVRGCCITILQHRSPLRLTLLFWFAVLKRNTNMVQQQMASTLGYYFKVFFTPEKCRWQQFYSLYRSIFMDPCVPCCDSLHWVLSKILLL